MSSVHFIFSSTLSRLCLLPLSFHQHFWLLLLFQHFNTSYLRTASHKQLGEEKLINLKIALTRIYFSILRKEILTKRVMVWESIRMCEMRNGRILAMKRKSCSFSSLKSYVPTDECEIVRWGALQPHFIAVSWKCWLHENLTLKIARSLFLYSTSAEHMAYIWAEVRNQINRSFHM